LFSAYYGTKDIFLHYCKIGTVYKQILMNSVLKSGKGGQETELNGKISLTL
jgi:hypothetical protein